MTPVSSLMKGEIFSHGGFLFIVAGEEDGHVLVDKYMHKINGRWKFNKSKERKKLPPILNVQRVRIKLENY